MTRELGARLGCGRSVRGRGVARDLPANGGVARRLTRAGGVAEEKLGAGRGRE